MRYKVFAIGAYFQNKKIKELQERVLILERGSNDVDLSNGLEETLAANFVSIIEKEHGKELSKEEWRQKLEAHVHELDLSTTQKNLIKAAAIRINFGPLAAA